MSLTAFFSVLLAFVVTLTTTPIARQLALKWRCTNPPDQRKFRAQSIPLMGGVTIYLGVAVPMLLLPHDPALLLPFMLAATLIMAAGLWDDRYGLAVLSKLMLQLTAAVILISGGIQLALPVPLWLNVVVTLIWIIGITNACNLLDNMDGLLSSVAAVAAAWSLLLSITLDTTLGVALAAAVIGATLGFLFYNIAPASIFMGDAGSLFLGLTMAVLGIEIQVAAPSTLSCLVPVLILGIPIFDTMLVILSRLRRGKNPLTTPGKDHLSHRLVGLGYSVRGSVMGIATLGLISGGLAVIVNSFATWIVWWIVGVSAAVAVISIVHLERCLSDE